MHIRASQEKEGLDKKNSPKNPDFLLGFGGNGPKNAVGAPFSQKGGWSLLGEFLLVACLFSLYAGTAAPEVNESHYLTKAKHFWEPQFASRDLFLASSDAHWFFFATVGWLSHVLSLPTAAWCGRILGWMAVALGWCLFMNRCTGCRWAGLITAPLWIASLHWGQLSGEWIVGGCEAKVFAYALSFIGLSEIVSHRWSRAWPWLGLAASFHVLTGGWLALAALMGYMTLKLRVDGRRVGLRSGSSEVENGTIEVEPFGDQWVGLIIGGCFSLLGLVPAILLSQGVDAATSERAAMIYVFERLPHHLSPLRFATERWISFGVLASVTLIFGWNYLRCSSTRHEPKARSSRLGTLMLMAGMVSLIAMAGVLIDFCLSSWAANWSAGLLRYYWFRWNDVIWPTMLAVIVIATARLELGNVIILGARSSEGGLPEEVESAMSKGFRWVAVLLLAIPGPLLIANRYFQNNMAILPPADRASLVMRTETVSMQKRVRDDWWDVCYWTRTNTPSDALFLTPRFQQTFKWYAHRAEVACWKDAPQDARGLIEWQKRLLEIFPRSPEGYGIPMSDQHLREMRLRYKMDYVIVDRRIQKQPPLLPLVHSNDTYAVFEFP